MLQCQAHPFARDKGIEGAKRLGEALLSKGINLPAVTLGLQPRPEDFDKVFVGAASAQAAAAYGSGWSNVPVIRPWPQHTSVTVHEVVSEELPAEAGRNKAFPAGYREIAAQLEPGVHWYALEFSGKQIKRTVLFDGLVYVGDHWAYFPKPYRVLR